MEQIYTPKNTSGEKQQKVTITIELCMFELV